MGMGRALLVAAASTTPQEAQEQIEKQYRQPPFPEHTCGYDSDFAKASKAHGTMGEQARALAHHHIRIIQTQLTQSR